MTCAWACAHSSVCSTSARAAFVSSVAWWRACSSRRAPEASASRSSWAESRFVFVRISRASLRASFTTSMRWRSRLLADALDLGLLLRDRHLALANLLLAARDLLDRGLLGVALDRVGELGGGAHQVERVHAHGVARRLGRRAARRGLEHAQLRLQRSDVTAVCLERLLDPARGHTVGCEGKILCLRERRQRLR